MVASDLDIAEEAAAGNSRSQSSAGRSMAYPEPGRLAHHHRRRAIDRIRRESKRDDKQKGGRRDAR